MPSWNNEAKSFYVAPDSRAWVKNAGEKRFAAVSGFAESGSAFHLILGGADYQKENRFCQNPEAAKLVVLRGKSPEAIVQRIQGELLPKLKADDSQQAVESVFRELLRDSLLSDDQSPFALSVVCVRRKLVAELESAVAGIQRAVAGNTVYQSPSGSYFAPNPLRSDKVAFMYGDGAAPYGGLGREIWRVFPQVSSIPSQS